MLVVVVAVLVVLLVVLVMRRRQKKQLHAVNTEERVLDNPVYAGTLSQSLVPFSFYILWLTFLAMLMFLSVNFHKVSLSQYYMCGNQHMVVRFNRYMKLTQDGR